MINLYGIRYWANLCWRRPAELKASMPRRLLRVYSPEGHLRVMRVVVIAWSVIVQGLIVVVLWNLFVPLVAE
jgi:hypothetical protein